MAARNAIPPRHPEEGRRNQSRNEAGNDYGEKIEEHRRKSATYPAKPM